MEKITRKRELFAQHLAAHGNATEAYKAAFDCRAMRPRSIVELAYRTAHEPTVRARVRELLAVAAEGTMISARARMVRLQEIVECDPGECVRVVSEACRWCHGKAHAYQWIDLAEYCQALSATLDHGKPLPSDEGGYGYDAHREAEEDCPKCHGEGVQRVVVTPTDRLSASARKLIKGIRQKASGEIEVHFHDPLVASDQLNRMASVYVQRSENKNLNLSLNASAPINASAADILDAYRASKELTP